MRTPRSFDADQRAARSRWSERRRLDAIARGLCARCLRQPPAPGRRCCEACLAYASARAAPKRRVGCRHCGSREHFTKTCGRDPLAQGTHCSRCGVAGHRCLRPILIQLADGTAVRAVRSVQL